MTRDIAVPDEVFDALRPHFNERQIVELSVLIGLYKSIRACYRAQRSIPSASRVSI